MVYIVIDGLDSLDGLGQVDVFYNIAITVIHLRLAMLYLLIN